MIKLEFKKLSDFAKAPTKAYENDLGVDLYAAKDYTISPNTREIIETHIAFQFPEGWGGFIKDRSSMAARGLHCLGGVIDEGYTGEVKIILVNLSDEIQNIKRGDKIAQLVLIKRPFVILKEVENLRETARNQRGFGSSGKK